MASIRTVFQALILLVLLKQTLQVDISLEWWPDITAHFEGLVEGIVSARWNNVPPGTCCKPRPWQVPSTQYFHAGEAKFYGLRQNQFGAGWAATGVANEDIINCTGAPILRVFGPGTGAEDSIVVYNPPWGEDIDGTLGSVVFAASWVDLRLKFPPDSAGTRYLQWQGLKRAIWGTDTWSAESNGIPFPRKKRSSQMRKLNGRVQHGTAFISAPTRCVYPDVYTVNETEFTHKGNGTYVSKNGKVLGPTEIVD
ncbi:MAG: hypothetical protein LQ338_006651 [Usnochroma carphineum]|nr:MAG: hypothetical protein LQ338_006651 [Usnochroma carphineum]